MAWTLSRWVSLLLALATLLVVGLLYVNSRRPPAPVSVVRVDRENLNSSISSNGKVEPIEPYALRAKFDGFVNRVLAVEGQTVSAGQLLLILDDTDVAAQLAAARAQLATEEDDLRTAQAGGPPDQAARLTGDLRAAEAQRNLLQRTQEALAKLVEEKAATPEELEKNRVELDRANGNLEQLRQAKEEFDRKVQLDRTRLALLVERSRAAVQDLRDKVNSARVTAPAAGTLFSMPVHTRDFVHTGDLLADVADLRKVRVRAYIDEPELGELKPGQAVEVTWDALPGRIWTGRTETLPRQVVALGARNVGELLCSVSNDGRELIPNTTVDVSIEVSTLTNSLVVPRGAVQIVGSHRYVFVVNGDRLHRQEIQVGISNATKLGVLSGVREGDTVALPGSTTLKDNMVVRVMDTE